MALCAMGMSIAIGFTTAFKLWGFRGVVDKRIHILTPHAASPEIAGVVVHRCRRIDAVDLVPRPDGIRVTSPQRTLFDSADLLGVRAARSVMEQILHEKLCTLGTINDTSIRLAHPNRPGSRTMAEMIGSRPAWRAALHSALELRVLMEIERHRDMNRDRKAGTVGWLVPRVSKIDVNGGLADAVGDVGLILRHAARSFSHPPTGAKPGRVRRCFAPVGAGSDCCVRVSRPTRCGAPDGQATERDAVTQRSRA